MKDVAFVATKLILGLFLCVLIILIIFKLMELFLKITKKRLRYPFGLTNIEKICFEECGVFFSKRKTFAKCIDKINKKQDYITPELLDLFLQNPSNKFSREYMCFKKILGTNMFTPYCKGTFVTLYIKNMKINTSIGQLIFYKWAFNKGLMKYARDYIINLSTEKKNKNEIKYHIVEIN